jgi:hypothetical protein
MSCIKTSISSFVAPISLSWFFNQNTELLCREGAIGRQVLLEWWSHVLDLQFSQMFWLLLEKFEDKNSFMGDQWGHTRTWVWFNALYYGLRSLVIDQTRGPTFSICTRSYKLCTSPEWGCQDECGRMVHPIAWDTCPGPWWSHKESGRGADKVTYAPGFPMWHFIFRQLLSSCNTKAVAARIPK